MRNIVTILERELVLVRGERNLWLEDAEDTIGETIIPSLF